MDRRNSARLVFSALAAMLAAAAADAVSVHITTETWGKIRSKSANDLCLDFEGRPAGLGDEGQLWPCNDTDDDGKIRFMEELPNSGIFRLEVDTDSINQLCVGKGGGDRLVLVSCQDPLQLLRVRPIDAFSLGTFDPERNAGYFKLQDVDQTTHCIDISGQPGKKGDPAQLWPCDDTDRDGELRWVKLSGADACDPPNKSYGTPNASPALPSPSRQPTLELPFVTRDAQGHRGARGNRPENTLAAFEYALEEGVTTLELDVVLSRDGRPVVNHDDDISLTCDYRKGLAGSPPSGHPKISDMFYSDIVSSYDCGYTVNGSFPDQQSVCDERRPLLHHVLEFAEDWTTGNDQIAYNIEAKAFGDFSWDYLVDRIAEVVYAYGAETRTTLQAFNNIPLEHARENYKELQLSRLMSTCSSASPFHVASVKHTLFKFHVCSMGNYQDFGFLVAPWTPNTSSDISEMASQGADAIITDYPGRAVGHVRTASCDGKLISKSPGRLCLDIEGRPGGQNDEAQLWRCDDTTLDGEFDFVSVGGGYHQLQSRVDPDLCLDIESGPGSSGGKGDDAQLWPCNDTGVDGHFKVVQAGSSKYFKLESKSVGPSGCSDLCLDVSGRPGGWNDRAQLWCCNDTDIDGLFAYCQNNQLIIP